MGKEIQKIFSVLLIGCGSFYAGFIFSKKKYEKLINDEIESVKNAYEKHYSELTKDINTSKKSLKEKKEVKDKPLDAEDVDTYHDYASKYDGKSSRRIPGKPLDKDIHLEEMEGTHISPDPSGPYVISQEEFIDSGMESITIYYFEDKVVCDEDYNILDNVDDTIGEESLMIFDTNPEVVSVYVANEELEIVYEIIRDERYFSKVSHRPTPGLDEED